MLAGVILTDLAVEPSKVNIFVPSVDPPLNLIIRSSSVAPDVGIFTVLAALPSYVPVTAPVNVNAFGLGNLVGIFGIKAPTAVSKSVISSDV